jgi:NAD(P)-dependent dehydrogenase (short-subunit alcohol dehydrogenase family)
MNLGLSGRTAIVTGAASGIGRATALLLAEEGCRVVVTDRDAKGLSELVDRSPGAFVPVAGDLTDAGAPARLVDAATTATGRLDILVAAAGVWERTPLDRLGDDVWDSVIAVNLTAPFRCARAAIPVMAERGFGRIVTVSSIAAKTGGDAAGAAYVASKAGIVGLTRSLARAAGPLGITVNCITPGLIDTPMIEDADPEQTQATLRRMPVGRLGTPEEVAGVIAMLVSDGTEFVTGAQVDVSGGFVMG